MAIINTPDFKGTVDNPRLKEEPPATIYSENQDLMAPSAPQVETPQYYRQG